jgi:hypothetical protein
MPDGQSDIHATGKCLFLRPVAPVSLPQQLRLRATLAHPASERCVTALANCLERAERATPMRY